MKFQSTILTVADVRKIKTLPNAFTAIVLVDVHEGAVEKGDIASFNGEEREVLDVAPNTDFFDDYAEGSLGIALGGAMIDGDDIVGRSLIVAGE